MGLPLLFLEMMKRNRTITAHMHAIEKTCTRYMLYEHSYTNNDTAACCSIGRLHYVRERGGGRGGGGRRGGGGNKYPYPPRAREALPSNVRAGGTHPSGGERGEARGQGRIKDSDVPMGLMLLMMMTMMMKRNRMGTVHTRVDRNMLHAGLHCRLPPCPEM